MSFQLGGISVNKPTEISKEYLGTPNIPFSKILGESISNSWDNIKYLSHKMQLDSHSSYPLGAPANIYQIGQGREPILTEEEYKKSEYFVPNVDVTYGIPERLASALYEDKIEKDYHDQAMNYYYDQAPIKTFTGDVLGTLISPEGLATLPIGGSLTKAVQPLFSLTKSLTKGLGLTAKVGISSSIGAVSGVPFYIASGIEDLRGGEEINYGKIGKDAAIFTTISGGLTFLGITGRSLYNRYFSNEVHEAAIDTAATQMMNGRQVKIDPLIKRAVAMTEKEEVELALNVHNYYQKNKGDKDLLIDAKNRLESLGVAEEGEGILKNFTEEEVLDAEMKLRLNDKYKNMPEEELIKGNRDALQNYTTKLASLPKEAKEYLKKQNILDKEGYKIDYERELATLTPENKKSILKGFQGVDKQVDGINKALEEYTKCLIG